MLNLDRDVREEGAEAREEDWIVAGEPPLPEEVP
jgi:hypothetical protein